MCAHGYSIADQELGLIYRQLQPRLRYAFASVQNFFDVLATNEDRNGVEFASLMEAKHYPFFTSQFHPEKNAAEWSQGWESERAEAHSSAAVGAMSYFAKFFVDEARKSQHRWVAGTLIYDAPTVLRTVNATTQRYEQTYVWRGA